MTEELGSHRLKHQKARQVSYFERLYQLFAGKGRDENPYLLKEEKQPFYQEKQETIHTNEAHLRGFVLTEKKSELFLCEKQGKADIER